MPREFVELATAYGNGFGLAFQVYWITTKY